LHAVLCLTQRYVRKLMNPVMINALVKSMRNAPAMRITSNARGAGSACSMSAERTRDNSKLSQENHDKSRRGPAMESRLICSRRCDTRVIGWERMEPVSADRLAGEWEISSGIKSRFPESSAISGAEEFREPGSAEIGSRGTASAVPRSESAQFLKE
jgi:hypothetical protein